MARAREPHPADVANANVVASAVRFEIALFLGVGRYATDTAETLDEARRKAAGLVAMHRNGRRPLIYGITADGRSGLVTDTPNMEDPMKTYAKKFNAQRAAKAVGHDTDEIDIIKTKDGFTWRVKRHGQSSADTRNAKLAHDPSRELPADGAKHSAAPKRPLGRRATIEAAAREGKLPEPPDFSAPTHTRFRNKLASVVELAKAGDLKGCKPSRSIPSARARKQSPATAISASPRLRRASKPPDHGFAGRTTFRTPRGPSHDGPCLISRPTLARPFLMLAR